MTSYHEARGSEAGPCSSSALELRAFNSCDEEAEYLIAPHLATTLVDVVIIAGADLIYGPSA